jgi:hypothetical protein
LTAAVRVKTPPRDRITFRVDTALIDWFYLPMAIAIAFAEVIRKLLTIYVLAS